MQEIVHRRWSHEETSACAQDVHNMDVAKPAALGLIRRGSARAMAAQCRPGRALARPDSSRAYGVEQATVPASQPAEIRPFAEIFVIGWEWMNCNYRSSYVGNVCTETCAGSGNGEDAGSFFRHSLHKFACTSLEAYFDIT